MNKKNFTLLICAFAGVVTLSLAIYYRGSATVFTNQDSEIVSPITKDRINVVPAKTSREVAVSSSNIGVDVHESHVFVKKHSDLPILDKISHQLDITNSDIIPLEINKGFIDLLEPGDSFLIDLPGNVQEKIIVTESGSENEFGKLRGHVSGYPDETMFYLVFDEKGAGSGYLNTLHGIYSYRTMFKEFFVASNIKSGSDPRQ